MEIASTDSIEQGFEQDLGNIFLQLDRQFKANGLVTTTLMVESSTIMETYMRDKFINHKKVGLGNICTQMEINIADIGKMI